MKTANIATAKNELSRLLRHVKRGETVVITERNHPVARLQPLVAQEVEAAPLYASGALTPPKSARWNVRAFLAALPSNAPLPSDQSLTAAVLDEREERT